MSTDKYARIAITIPPEDLAAADRLAAAQDRSRSWIVAEAVRHYVAQMDGAAPLGQSRHAQLLRDLGLTAEERVRDAEQRDLLAVAPSLANAIEQPLRFATYAEFAEWRGRQESK
jgi:hypothetical protein